jgi:hypothetical protein
LRKLDKEGTKKKERKKERTKNIPDKTKERD